MAQPDINYSLSLSIFTDRDGRVFDKVSRHFSGQCVSIKSL